MDGTSRTYKISLLALIRPVNFSGMRKGNSPEKHLHFVIHHIQCVKVAAGPSKVKVVKSITLELLIRLCY